MRNSLPVFNLRCFRKVVLDGAALKMELGSLCQVLESSSSALRGGTNACGEQEVLVASGINTSPHLRKSECDYVPAELERISPEESLLQTGAVKCSY